MWDFSRTYVSKSKHVRKKAPRCKHTNVFDAFHTWWVKVKHLPKCTCVVVNTHVWLVLNIFAKSQTCVEKTIVFSPNIPTLFFEGNKDFVIRSCSQFKTESSSLVILLGVTSSSLKLKDSSLPLKICYLWLNSFRPFWLDSTKKACDFIDKSRKAIFFQSICFLVASWYFHFSVWNDFETEALPRTC